MDRPKPRPAIFLDRDGVLNNDHGYVFDPLQLQVLPGVALALKTLKDYGYQLIVVSNQSGVARGFFSTAQVEAFNAALDEALRAEHGTGIDAFYYCPFHPEGTVPAYTAVSPLRKPEPGMVLLAAAEHQLDLSRSYLVGDRAEDIECAVRAGVKGIQVRAPGRSRHPQALGLVGGLSEALNLIEPA